MTLQQASTEQRDSDCTARLLQDLGRGFCWAKSAICKEKTAVAYVGCTQNRQLNVHDPWPRQCSAYIGFRCWPAKAGFLSRILH